MYIYVSTFSFMVILMFDKAITQGEREILRKYNHERRLTGR